MKFACIVALLVFVSACQERVHNSAEIKLIKNKRLIFKPLHINYSKVSPTRVRSLVLAEFGIKPYRPSPVFIKQKNELQGTWTYIGKLKHKKQIPSVWKNVQEGSLGSIKPYIPGKNIEIGGLKYLTTTHFGLKHFTTDHGIPGSSVQCLLQDKQGKIWIGTDNGLAVYTGSSIEILNINQGLPNNFISALTEGENGVICIGTKGGIAFFDGIKFTVMNAKNGLLSDWVTAMHFKKGSLWIGSNKGVQVFYQNVLRTLAPMIGANQIFVNNISSRNADQTIVCYQESGIDVFSGKGMEHLGIENGLPSNMISSAAFSNHELWLGTIDQGIVRIKNDSIFQLNCSIPAFLKLSVNSVYIDQAKRTWISSYSNGVFAIAANTSQITHINSSNGYFTPSVSLCLMETFDGKILSGGAGGIAIFNPLPIQITLQGQNLNGQIPISLKSLGDTALAVSTVLGGISIWKGDLVQSISTQNGLSSNNIMNLDSDAQGRIYLASSGNGLDILDKNTVYNLDAAQGILSSDVNAVLYSKNNGLLIGTNSAGLYQWDGKTLFNFGPGHGIKSNSIYNLSEDEKGRIFIGTNGDGLLILKEDSIGAIDVSNGLSGNVVYPILAKPEIVLIGTFGGGLSIIHRDSISSIKEADGLPNDLVSSITEDKFGNFLCGTGKGLAVIRFAKDFSYQIQKYTKKEGLPYDAFTPYVGAKIKNSIFLGADNSLIELKGCNLFDTSCLTPEIFKVNFGNGLIYAKVANGFRAISAVGSNKMDVPVKFFDVAYEKNQINFDVGYTGRSFQESNIDFEYRLEGLESDWSRTSSSLIEYSRIPSGDYRFSIRGKGTNDVWSKLASISIRILPPWWETWWFRLIELLGVGGILYATVQFRTRNLVKQKEKLEGVVKERTEEIVKQKDIIEIEKEKSENLLLNILPTEVAEELKSSGESRARSFDSVTVLFTDFKDFTQIAEGLSATDLVQELDYCFRAFDEIVSKCGVEKIKTIGDAYMAAGGLPIPNVTHPMDVTNAALEIVQFMKVYQSQRAKKGLKSFQIRIGIHTGPLVAGIVGSKKFAYDIWGDTVNLASRMESSGEEGMVNVSKATYELIKDYFSCTPRGKIKAKNKGEVEMYFVNGPLEPTFEKHSNT